MAFGSLWESSGGYGSSRLRELRMADCALRWSGNLPDRLFGEGIFPSPTGIWQLTWKEGIAVHWDTTTRGVTAEIPYERQGWGACLAPVGAVTSDGSNELVIRDPVTLKPERVVEVALDGHPVFGLNDLTWAPEHLWANVYGIDCYVGVDLRDGSVSDVVDAREIRSLDGARTGDVLNGITCSDPTGLFTVTGKRWASLFEVGFVPADFDPLASFDFPSRPVF
jgi:glutamine cyclotransferase